MWCASMSEIIEEEDGDEVDPDYDGRPEKVDSLFIQKIANKVMNVISEELVDYGITRPQVSDYMAVIALLHMQFVSNMAAESVSQEMELMSAIYDEEVTSKDWMFG